MRRRRQPLPPPPRVEMPPPPRPSADLTVALCWALPPDVAPRQAEHALDLAVMRGHVSWWAWQGERVVVHTRRVRATLAALCPVLGQPVALALDDQTP